MNIFGFPVDLTGVIGAIGLAGTVVGFILTLKTDVAILKVEMRHVKDDTQLIKRALGISSDD